MFIILGIKVYTKRGVGWGGIRYEYYEDGKPKKRLTYAIPAKLIKVENYDRDGNIISVKDYRHHVLAGSK